MNSRLNLLAREVCDNPHPYLAELRRSAPIVQVDPGGIWAVTRYDDAQYVLKSTQLFSSEALRMAMDPEWLGRPNPIAESIIFLDPPKHGRLRTLVSRAFTPATLTQLEPRIRAVARELATRMVEQRKVDFVDAFAMPIPATVIGWFLGLDPSLQRHFKRWSNDIAAIGGARPEDTALMEQCRRTLDEMEQYLQGVLADRRRELGTDMVSDLIRARVDGESLTDQELMGFLFLLLVSGLETTANLLSQSARMFAMHPELLPRLREDRTLIPRFIEETLRLEPTAVATLRTCTQDVTVAGVELPKGSMVLVSLASAARDEDHFPKGDSFILEREGSPSLSFGHGSHFCLGSMLARLEARVALEELVSHVDRLELRTERIDWTPSLTVRGPQTLPVEVFPV
ncbi:cytochrome P450 [Corallococcus sp. AB011P]|uniref:cytochrome P450 n=1 Tax=unclassified Corallococcus TaxID=2685029 RepID=UPI000EA2F2BB|nr:MULTISPECIES: cytochrome P450 [unclassified Corallococcus]RKG55478.1 cytochrome P450 [Corallococcus sp. AB011P]RKH88279.1 cytochrome P450 [Corallococcus sp. AB045]